MENKESESRLITLESKVKELEFDIMISRLISVSLIAINSENAHALDSLDMFLNEYERELTDQDRNTLSYLISRWKDALSSSTQKE